MGFLEIRFAPVPSDEEKSILIAELLPFGFDSFNEEEDAVLAYIDSVVFQDVPFKEIEFLQNHPEIEYRIEPLGDINWNKEWESNYQPVLIGGKCFVRAPFHPENPDAQYNILIEPGMAFGTAHHETTRLMALCLMQLDVKGKKVLDMGCGTGILAVLANKMGAISVTGIDNDEWAWRNAIVNFGHNGISAENAVCGDASDIKEVAYDMILANINRNVLLQDMEMYFKGLLPGGRLMLSGFYRKDKETILEKAMATGLQFVGDDHENEWTVILLKK